MPWTSSRISSSLRVHSSAACGPWILCDTCRAGIALNNSSENVQSVLPVDFYFLQDPPVSRVDCPPPRQRTQRLLAGGCPPPTSLFALPAARGSCATPVRASRLRGRSVNTRFWPWLRERERGRERESEKEREGGRERERKRERARGRSTGGGGVDLVRYLPFGHSVLGTPPPPK